MKEVLMCIQPYWVFLIIARIMGWKIDKEKTIEVRKSFPKDQDWNRNVKIYCSKNEKSFKRIPKEYQPLMEKFLGEVIGEFVCEDIQAVNSKCSDCGIDLFYHDCKTKGCLTESEVDKYFNIPKDKDLRVMKGNGFAWRISDLKIYDKPKELSEFYIFDSDKRRPSVDCEYKKRGFSHDWCLQTDNRFCNELLCDKKRIKRPPQSWCYVEEL